MNACFCIGIFKKGVLNLRCNFEGSTELFVSESEMMAVFASSCDMHRALVLLEGIVLIQMTDVGECPIFECLRINILNKWEQLAAVTLGEWIASTRIGSPLSLPEIIEPVSVKIPQATIFALVG